MGARKLLIRFGTPPPGPGHRPGPAKGSAMFSERTWSMIASELNLSGRELQIVRGVFDDQTEITIAGGLGISPHTVHTHFSRLHRKLGVATRTQMSLRIMEEFLALAASPGSGLPSLCGRRSAGECPLSR
jgi:DNA-binding CsgD family transcriptional regulator